MEDRGIIAFVQQADSTATGGKDSAKAEPKPATSSAEAIRDDKQDRTLDRKLRKSYGYAFLASAVGWLIFVIVTVIASGVCNLFGRQFLSDAVLIALLSSTSLMGLLAIILRHLFSKK